MVRNEKFSAELLTFILARPQCILFPIPNGTGLTLSPIRTIEVSAAGVIEQPGQYGPTSDSSCQSKRSISAG
ncbi:hypothetical protein TNCT_186811 [Trichonephila clavata]|uniref:Uncharacterized protein n=1 Tax=Trichonephila clavata TaxID=2740835 RepID=A0A8X6GMP5_TRICU|nr:hypothetical protein TNCT_186811 [Trichonephila clavata]